MSKRRFFLSAAAALISIGLMHAAAHAGTVSIVNNFADAVRVGIYAGASESQVTVYAGESRNYTTFVSKSIDKIKVVNIAGGSNPVLGTYDVGNPSATNNFTVTVTAGGGVTILVSPLPTP